MAEHERASEQIRDTNTVVLQLRRVDAGDSGETLYRFVNKLDAEVHVDLAVTDDNDDAYNYTESVDIGGGTGDPDASTLSVAADSADSVYMTEPWPRVEFSVTAQTTPTSGEFAVREITRE